MSVVLLGMDMPESCNVCYISALKCDLWKEAVNGNRHSNCPFNPLPKSHGRLVDVDAIISELKDGDSESGVKASGADLVVAILLAYLDSRPIIVEAEGEYG